MSASTSRVDSPRRPGRDVLVELLLVRAARLVAHVTRIVGERRIAHRLAQAAEHRVLVGGDQHQAVARRIDVRRRDVRQDRAGALADVAGLVVLGDERLHHAEHGLVDRASRPPGRARCFSRWCSAEQRADAGEGRGQRVADRDADARRRRDRVADHVAQAAHRLADRAETGAPGVGPGLPVARDAHHDEPRVGGGELLVAEVPLLERAGPEILDQDVGLRDELEQESLPLGLAQVERDGLLVARDHRPPERRVALASGGPSCASGRPAPAARS